jgi:hypothetical protein
VLSTFAASITIGNFPGAPLADPGEFRQSIDAAPSDGRRGGSSSMRLSRKIRAHCEKKQRPQRPAAWNSADFFLDRAARRCKSVVKRSKSTERPDTRIET